MNLKIILIFLSLFIAPSLSFSNTLDSLERIILGLNNWSLKHPIEKVHLHLDKPYYSIGDTIWFKAYVTVGQKHHLSAFSKVLNVELINQENKRTLAIKLPVNAGVAWGDFTLADSLVSGNYRIRAYTNWMRNAGEDYFFDQIIAVGDYRNHKETGNRRIARKRLSEIADVQFFPESGHLVSGLPSRVAFKATDDSGRGIDIMGVIEDDENKKMAEFKTVQFGMGDFTFLPEEGIKYRARIRYSDGSVNTVSLPEVKEKGFVLAIDMDDPETVRIKITANSKTFRERLNTEINLMGQAGGIVYSAAKSKLESPVFTANIPKSRFPSGVVQFTLFNKNDIPLNERLVFIQNSYKLDLKVNPEKEHYKPGEKIRLNIHTNNQLHKATVGSFSVSVVDESKVPFGEADTYSIFSNLLLSSDLKGYIEKPNYYFTNNTDKTRSDLDLLMLTQGYSRFEWRQLLTDALPAPKYKAEKSLTISGKVKTFSGTPVANGEVTIMAPQGGLFVETKTDGEGNFQFSNLVFRDYITAIINARTDNGKKDLKILLDEDLGNVTSSIGINHTIDSASDDRMKIYLDNNRQLYGQLEKKSIQLKGVRVTAKKVVQTHSSNLAGLGNYDQLITSKEIGKMGGSLSGILRGKIRGVSRPRVVVDGVFLGPNDSVDDLNPSDVASVEVLRTAGTAAIYGPGSAGGVVVITTKRGNEDNNIPARDLAGVLKSNFTGFYLAKEFYTPKYSPIVTDLRSTIFWKPNFLTNVSGKATVEFDGTKSGTFRVIVEGIDINGNFGRKTLLFNID